MFCTMFCDINTVISTRYFRVLYSARSIERDRSSRSCPARPTFYRFCQLSKTFTQLFSSLAENFAGESWFNVTTRVRLATVFSSTYIEYIETTILPWNRCEFFHPMIFISLPLSRNESILLPLFYFRIFTQIKAKVIQRPLIRVFAREETRSISIARRIYSRLVLSVFQLLFSPFSSRSRRFQSIT